MASIVLGIMAFILFCFALSRKAFLAAILLIATVVICNIWINPMHAYILGIKKGVSKSGFIEEIKSWVLDQNILENQVLEITRFPKSLSDNLKQSKYATLEISRQPDNSRYLTYGSIGIAFGAVPSRGPFLSLGGENYVFYASGL